MKKALGLLFATSLLIPVSIWASSAAGSAVNTTAPSCKVFAGTETFTPGLPPLSSKTLVKPVQKVVAAFTGCTGGGITKGTANGSSKATVAYNCTQLFKDAAAKKPGKPTVSTIKWSNGQTSTSSSVLTVTGIKGTALVATIVGKTTAGLGKGHTTTINVLATPNAGWCAKSPFTKTTFKSTSITQK